MTPVIHTPPMVHEHVLSQMPRNAIQVQAGGRRVAANSTLPVPSSSKGYEVSPPMVLQTPVGAKAGRLHSNAVSGHSGPRAANPERLREDVLALVSVDRSDSEQSQAAAYITLQLRAVRGLKVVGQLLKRGGVNVIAEKPGQNPNEVVVLTAHFDTLRGGMGADDNASGVAGLLEAARSLQGITLQSTVIFAALNYEETGLDGAHALAAALKKSGRKVRGVINLEGIAYRKTEHGTQSYGPLASIRAIAALEGFAQSMGFPTVAAKVVAALREPNPVGDYLAVISNTQSAPLLRRVLDSDVGSTKVLPLLVPGDGEDFPDTRRSDHQVFWDTDVPALMLTDTSAFRNPHYHHDTDMPDTLDYEFLAQNTMFAVHALIEVAGQR